MSIFKHNYYYDLLIKQLRFFIPSGSSILDLGCGNGRILNALKPKRGVGIDINKKKINLAKKKYPQLQFYEQKIENFTSEEKFDYILLINTTGCLYDIQSTLEQVKKNCNHNTRLIILHYNFLWLPALKLAENLNIKKKDKIRNWLSPTDIMSFLKLSGYDLIQSSNKILFPIWFPALSNFVNKYVANLPLVNKLDLMSFYIARVKSVMPQNDRTCSIIIPARNEAGNIEAAVKRITQLGNDTEIIFVEGNSTDNTWEEIKRVTAKYGKKGKLVCTKQPGKGKGDAVRHGFELAKNNILFILDSDLTVPPEELKKFYNLVVSGETEFVNGSRLVYPMEKKAMRFINLFGNKMFSLIFTFLLNQRFKDTLCGTKVITKENYNKIARSRNYFGDFDPFGDFDLIFGASKLSLKITELPIHYKERTYGDTNIQRWKHGLILFRMCLFAMRKIKFL